MSKTNIPYSKGFDKEDPMNELPENVSERIMDKTAMLSRFLSTRSEYLQKMLSELKVNDDLEADGNSIALIERIAFNECLLESAVMKLDDLEQRLGGRKASN
tara:strand:- start:14912 stop:15217 length:306 start_codon:yes stop_codon:yes gene_type:complete